VTCVHDIIRKDLNIFPHTNLFYVEQISYHRSSLDFCRWTADVADNYVDAFHDVSFIDEFYLLLSGNVCKQNLILGT
jgi:hypothetical protein